MNDKMIIVPIPLDMLEPHPDNPRKDLGDLTELADSIKANGIMQNLTVVASPDPDKYRVVIGHRRLAAAKLAGLRKVPCIISEMDEKEQISTMLLENMQRSDLTPYEQAWGFRQLSILGCSVEEISDKSGFSQSTVRRRLKLAELDQEKLKEVSSSRQLNLKDFDRLGEIEDIEKRNEVLDKIGTGDFELSLKRAIDDQKAVRNLPLVRAWLKEHKAKKLKPGEQYNGAYRGYGGSYGYIYIYKWGEENNQPPKVTDKQIYYLMDETTIRFFEEQERPVREKKSREQLDREKLAREVKAEIRKISADHYQLRKAFVDRLTVTKENKEAVLMGAVLFGLYGVPTRGREVYKYMGLSAYEYNTGRVLDAIGKITDGAHNKELAQAIYLMFEDKESNWFASYMDMTGCVPYWDKGHHNTGLVLLYNWLMSLGYEMSHEELDMMDGSHEVYHRGDAK